MCGGSKKGDGRVVAAVLVYEEDVLGLICGHALHRTQTIFH